MEIVQMTEDSDLEKAAQVVRAAFSTVAREMGLSRENAPSHPSFTTAEDLKTVMEKGVMLFGGYADGVMVGFAALEHARSGNYYLEKLAVLPQQRHNGYGEQLVDFVSLRAAELGAESIQIGIIEEQDLLKDWYLGLGFVEKRTRRFEQLPFTVCFMGKELG